MCGRYSLNLPSSKTSFKKETIEKYPKVFDYVNGDIAPSTFNPIIFKRQDEYIFEFAKWGFEYDWLPKENYYLMFAQKQFLKNHLAII